MRKVFVDVNSTTTKDGKMTPNFFIWDDGRRFEIDRVLDTREAVSLKVGGQGQRYKCRVRGKVVFLFYEEGRWFMEGN